MYRLENWSTGVRNPYLAPEQQALYLHGDVYDRPSYEDGESISTTRIANVDGNVITTRSGSVYLLGEPDPKFIEYCKEQGVYVPTKEVPIKEIKNDN